jgi:hypothetical protein
MKRKKGGVRVFRGTVIALFIYCVILIYEKEGTSSVLGGVRVVRGTLGALLYVLY